MPTPRVRVNVARQQLLVVPTVLSHPNGKVLGNLSSTRRTERRHASDRDDREPDGLVDSLRWMYAFRVTGPFE
jgi:hypothetical protein